MIVPGRPLDGRFLPCYMAPIPPTISSSGCPSSPARSPLPISLSLLSRDLSESDDFVMNGSLSSRARAARVKVSAALRAAPPRTTATSQPASYLYIIAEGRGGKSASLSSRGVHCCTLRASGVGRDQAETLTWDSRDLRPSGHAHAWLRSS